MNIDSLIRQSMSSCTYTTRLAREIIASKERVESCVVPKIRNAKPIVFRTFLNVSCL